MKVVLKSIKVVMLIFVILICSTNTKIIKSKVSNNNIKNSVDLSTMAMKINEFDYDLKYSALDTYIGDLTGYIYNCPACGGHLACLSSYDISDGKTTYHDDTYGDVRIVASSSNLMCGTILRFSSDRVSNETVYAIVLDRGVRGNALDLLSSSYEEATRLGRISISYDVVRNGW